MTIMNNKTNYNYFLQKDKYKKIEDNIRFQ